MIRKAEEEALKRNMYCTFFAMDKIPPRFRTLDFQADDGRMLKLSRIDDVVRWSLTGKRAQGKWDDEPQEAETSCQSGFCE